MYWKYTFGKNYVVNVWIFVLHRKEAAKACEADNLPGDAKAKSSAKRLAKKK